MPTLYSKEPPQPYVDPLLYDKAKVVSISHFVDTYFHKAAVHGYVDIVHCIRSHTADSSDKLMLKRELFLLLPIASEYVVSSGVCGTGKSFVRLAHQLTGKEFIITKDGLSDTLSEEDKNSGTVLESNFRVSTYSKRHLIDELIRAFPFTDFSFLS